MEDKTFRRDLLVLCHDSFLLIDRHNYFEVPIDHIISDPDAEVSNLDDNFLYIAKSTVETWKKTKNEWTYDTSHSISQHQVEINGKFSVDLDLFFEGKEAQ